MRKLKPSCRSMNVYVLRDSYGTYWMSFHNPNDYNANRAMWRTRAKLMTKAGLKPTKIPGLAHMPRTIYGTPIILKGVLL